MPRFKTPTKEQSQLLPAFAQLPDNAIYVPQTEAEFAHARSVLLSQSVLGFDTESKPIFHINQPDTGPHVVQLATPYAAWILQLHLPQALALAREVIANSSICKVGFGLDNDKSTLPKRLGVTLENVVDLDRVFKQYGYGASTGVRAAVALVLGKNFHKSKKQSTSNWAQPQLSQAQIRYAANDAHAPALVFAALPAWQAAQAAPTTSSLHHQRKKPVPAPATTTQSNSATSSATNRQPQRAALLQAPKKPIQ